MNDTLTKMMYTFTTLLTLLCCGRILSLIVLEYGISYSWGCNTAAARHHERTCIDMDVIVVQAAFPPIFDQHLFRKALILDIGVCIMEEK